MMKNWIPIFVQFALGTIFGYGLVLSGMSNPEKVLNFLDVASISAGGWDPSLALVMAAGVVVTFVGYRIVLNRNRPLFDKQFHLSHFSGITAPIILGPTIFGVGWGLVGFCPGPAITAVGTGSGAAILFVVTMLAGMVAARLLALRTASARLLGETK